MEAEDEGLGGSEEYNLKMKLARDQLLIRKLMEMEVYEKAIVSEEAVRRAYEARGGDRGETRVRHILASVPAKASDAAEAVRRETIYGVVEVARTGARRVAISVRDQGIGITSHELKRVFRRFYRLPAALQSRVRGTGIGLSIVFAVARRHGGRAYAESRGAERGSPLLYRF